MQRHRHVEFIRFLNTVEREVAADKSIHVVLDNYATYKHPKVLAWLARHPRWTFHFTPTSASWLNAVENFFSKMTRQRIRRGVFRSLADLQAAINPRCVAAAVIADTQAQRSSHSSSMRQPLNTLLTIIVSLSPNDANTRRTGIQANRRARRVKTDSPRGCAGGLRPPSYSIAVSRRFPLRRAMSPAWPTPHPR